MRLPKIPPNPDEELVYREALCPKCRGPLTAHILEFEDGCFADFLACKLCGYEHFSMAMLCKEHEHIMRVDNRGGIKHPFKITSGEYHEVKLPEEDSNKI
jgi:hypothetical protein